MQAQEEEGNVMKIKIEKKYLQIGLILLVVALLAIGFCYIIYHNEIVKAEISQFTGKLSPIIDGLIIAFLITPMVNFIENRLPYCFLTPKGKEKVKKKNAEKVRAALSGNEEEVAAFKKKLKTQQRLKRTISIILSLIILGLLVYAFLYSVIPQIKESVENIYSKSSTYYANTKNYLDGLAKKHPDIAAVIEKNWEQYYDLFAQWRDNTLMPKIKEIATSAASGVLSFFSTIWNIIIGLIISIYIVAGKEKFSAQFKKVFYGLFGTKGANRLINNIRFTNDKFSGFIVGKIVDSIIIGVITLICCYIFKFDYPVLIALIIGVTNIIPFFGPIFGAIPCFVLLFMISPLKSLYFLIFVLALQQFDGNILGPKILGESTGVSGLWVIVSITFFGGIWGVPGMIIGVPLFAVLYAAVKTLIENKLEKDGYPKETEKYYDLDYVKEEDKEFVHHPRDYRMKKDSPKGKDITTVIKDIFKNKKKK